MEYLTFLFVHKSSFVSISVFHSFASWKTFE